MEILKRLSRLILACACLVLLFSCGATYQEKTANLQGNLFLGNFETAAAEIDQNKFLQKERNRLLYLLEKAKIEHLNGNYQESNRLFEEAYILIDDRIKSNAGQEIAAKLTNPLAEPYKGEDFEKVTLHYYKALNFYQMGMPMKALVEAKRINIKLNELNTRYKKNKNKFTEDAFSQILQGILYEATGDVNNAFIAYRNATDLYLENEGTYYGVPLPEQLKKDLLRTANEMGFRNEYLRYSEKFGLSLLPEVDGETEIEAEAIVFWENGLGPAKDQTIVTASGAGGVFVGTYGEGSIAIPIPPGVNIGINAIAIPYYKQRNSYYNKASIIVDEKEIPFCLSQNFYPIARQCLKDRMMREVVDMAARFVTKKAASKGLGILADNLIGGVAGDLTELGTDALGAATEQADTRNWQTLPATISYARIPLVEGADNTFVIKKYGPASIDYDTLHVEYRKGLQLVNYSDLGRTTTGFVNLPDAKAVANTAITPGMERLNQLEGDILADTLDSATPDISGGGDKALDLNAKATVYLIRKKKFVATLVRMPVFCNGQSPLKIGDGQFCKIQAAPGNFVLHSNETGWESKEMNIEIEAGKTYYVLVEAKMGMWSAKAKYSMISAEEGQGYLSQYKNISTSQNIENPSGSKKFEKNRGNIKLVIIRDNRNVDAEKNIPVFVNGEFAFKIQNESYEILHVRPGKLHLESMSYDGTEWKPGFIELYIVPDKTHYVLCRVDKESGANGVAYEILNDKTGEKYLQKYPENSL